jgi:hypothetical protein
MLLTFENSILKMKKNENNGRSSNKNIIYSFTKRDILMRRPTVLSFSLKLVFHATNIKHFSSQMTKEAY